MIDRDIHDRVADQREMIVLWRTSIVREYFNLMKKEIVRMKLK